jgi:DNA-binding MarR family transcriptional regulator
VNGMDPLEFGLFANEILKIAGFFGSDKSFIEGLTPKQVHIIMDIDKNTFRHGDLAGSLGVDPSTLTRTLDPLDKAGIIERQLNPENRREVLIRLSDKGLNVLEEVNNKMRHVCAHILNHVPEDNREQVDSSISLLLKIMRSLSLKH